MVKFNNFKNLPFTFKVLFVSTTVGAVLGGCSLLYTLAHLTIQSFKALQSLEANTLSIAESLRETTSQLADLQAQLDKLTSAQTLEQNTTPSIVEQSPQAKSYFTYENMWKTVSICCIVGVVCFVGYSAYSSLSSTIVSQSVELATSLTQDLDGLNITIETLEKTVSSTVETGLETKSIVEDIYNHLSAPDSSN